MYAAAAEKFPYPKNTHLGQALPSHPERKKGFRELVERIIKSGAVKGPE
jgi:hypothetical protein